MLVLKTQHLLGRPVSAGTVRRPMPTTGMCIEVTTGRCLMLRTTVLEMASMVDPGATPLTLTLSGNLADYLFAVRFLSFITIV